MSGPHHPPQPTPQHQPDQKQLFDQQSLTQSIQQSLPPLPPTLPALPPPTNTSMSSDSPSPIASTSSATPAAPTSTTSAAASTPSKDKGAKKTRKSKVAEACKFCRRSHMSCDAGRPCGRCVKRDIAHLCRDEPGGIQPGPGNSAGGGGSPQRVTGDGQTGATTAGAEGGAGLGLEGFGGSQHGGMDLDQGQAQAQVNLNGGASGSGDVLGGQLLPPTSTASSIPAFAPASNPGLPQFNTNHSAFNANFNMAMVSRVPLFDRSLSCSANSLRL